MSIENGQRLVLLDDIHERSIPKPVRNPKTGAVKGYQKERDTYQTEVYLSPEDSERFIKIYG
jgi:hypothetical protein